MKLGGVFLVLLLITSCGKGKESANFQIIIDRPNSESQLLLSDTHMDRYSFTNHEVFLNESGVEQIMNVVMDEESTFRVLFKEDTLAYGTCVFAALSSFPTELPVIYYGTHERLRLSDSNSFRIYCYKCAEGFDGLKSPEVKTYLSKKAF